MDCKVQILDLKPVPRREDHHPRCHQVGSLAAGAVYLSHIIIIIIIIMLTKTGNLSLQHTCEFEKGFEIPV